MNIEETKFYTDRESVINKFQELQELGLISQNAVDDAKLKDKTVQILLRRTQCKDALKTARSAIWNTVCFSKVDAKGNVQMKVFDTTAFEEQQGIITKTMKHISLIESTIRKLDSMNYGFYTDIKKQVDIRTHILSNLNQKLDQLKNSTRFDQADIKAIMKDVQAEISVTQSEYQKYTDMLSSMDLVFAECGS